MLTTAIFSVGFTWNDRPFNTAGKCGAYFTTRSCTMSSPSLVGHAAGGRLSCTTAGASWGTSRYSTIRSTELKSSSTCARTLVQAAGEHGA